MNPTHPAAHLTSLDVAKLEVTMSKKIVLLAGQRFCHLVVIKEVGRDKGRNILYLCKCDCGSEVIVRGEALRHERVRSCGCLKREKSSERLKKSNKKHGLCDTYPRLYRAISTHFSSLRKGVNGYNRWELDHRYPDNVDGVVRFCRDLLALQPEACERYEMDKTLDLDKDNDTENLFRPESIVFIPRAENRSKQYNNIRFNDGCSLVNFCRRVGVPTRTNGIKSHVYDRIVHYYKYNNSAHPELVEAANRAILEMRQCLELLRLLDDVRAFKRRFKILT